MNAVVHTPDDGTPRPSPGRRERVDAKWIAPFLHAHDMIVALTQFFWDGAEDALEDRMEARRLDAAKLADLRTRFAQEADADTLTLRSGRRYLKLGVSKNVTLRRKANWVTTQVRHVRKQSSFLTTHTTSRQIGVVADAMCRALTLPTVEQRKAELDALRSWISIDTRSAHGRPASWSGLPFDPPPRSRAFLRRTGHDWFLCVDSGVSQHAQVDIPPIEVVPVSDMIPEPLLGYAATFDMKLRYGRGLVLAGGRHANAIAAAVADAVARRYVVETVEFDALLKTMSSNDWLDQTASLRRADLVVVNNVTSPARSPFKREALDNVLYHRQNQLLPTIITTYEGAGDLAAAHPRVGWSGVYNYYDVSKATQMPQEWPYEATAGPHKLPTRKRGLDDGASVPSRFARADHEQLAKEASEKMELAHHRAIMEDMFRDSVLVDEHGVFHLRSSSRREG